MKIFPLRPLSNLDKAKNLIKIIEKNKEYKEISTPNYDRKVEMLGKEYTIREIRSIYKFVKTRMEMFLGK